MHKKESKEGDKEEVEELRQGGLKALLPWGMNLQSPMLRGKKAHLPFELDAYEWSEELKILDISRNFQDIPQKWSIIVLWQLHSFGALAGQMTLYSLCTS